MKKHELCVPLLLSLTGLFGTFGCTRNSSDSATTLQNVSDSTAISEVVTSPGNGAIAVPTNAQIALTFPKAMKFSTVNVGSVVVTDPSGRVIPGTFSYSGLTASFIPTANLAPAVYTVTLGKAITAADGGTLKYGQYAFQFTVGDPPVPHVTTNYTYKDNSTAGGPGFAYLDISSTGTPLAFTNPDDGTATLVTPFPLFLFGTPATTWTVNVNGWMTPGLSTRSDYADFPFPSNQMPMIAPMFTDLMVEYNPGASVCWQVLGSAPARQLVLQYHNVCHYYNSGTADFEVIFYENSENILFQYLSTSALASWPNGVSATVGLNLGDGISASQYSYNTSSLGDGKAILFTATGGFMPAAGATAVNPKTSVGAVFSTPMLASSLASPATTFTVAPTLGGSPIDGQVTLVDNIATFQPSTPLAYGTSYTATLATGAMSSAGVPLGAPITWSFTTALPGSLTYVPLGTSTHPTQVGPFAMTAFGTDGSGAVSLATLASPTGGHLGFAPALIHQNLASGGWASWSNGYEGDVYTGIGTYSCTLTMPPGTRAFSFYVEPAQVPVTVPCTVLCTTADGETDQETASIAGQNGAGGFAFYSQVAPIATITLTVPLASGGFAVGEFGIAGGLN